MRYVLLISYDGTAYGGWQIQPNAVTVQQKLSEAVESVVGYKVNVRASGRTDSGVHAAGQVCQFDAESSVPPDKMSDALNCLLPDDISVLTSAAAPENFDVADSAKRKTYCYRVYTAKHTYPLKDRYAVKVNYAPDEKKLAYAAKLFTGEHDFKAYCAAGSQVKTTVRRIYSVDVKARESFGCTDLEIRITGNGFLYNMVRTLAGTMLYFAAGRISEGDILRSLERCDRSAVGKTMPAKGLTLESVDYGIKLF